jgi:Iron/manganese superoxide dismutases, alpha-hairpin domain
MTFTLPNLPYAHDALGPYMSKETLEFHHDKHHQAYVTNGNNAIKGTEFEGKSLEEIVKGSFGKNAAVFNNAGQHYNHLHFWNWMKPNGGGTKLPGRLEKKINEDLGGFEKFKTDFIAAGVGQGRQARDRQDAEWGEPAGAWCNPDPRLRCLGALLLHRLSQPPSRLSQGVRRESRELGLCRSAVRQGLIPSDVIARSDSDDPSTLARKLRRVKSPPKLEERRRKQSSFGKASWIASAFALRRFGGLEPGVACAASVDGSSLRSSQ